LCSLLQYPVTFLSLTPKDLPQRHISKYPQHMVFHQCDRTSFTPIQNNRHHTHTHTHTFSSVSPSTVLHELHLFQAVSHSRFPIRDTYLPISSDSISSSHESIMSIIFSRKHCKYVNSHSLIFTVLTSHVTCGQQLLPCH